MRYVKIKADGVTFEVWKEADHDTRLRITEGPVTGELPEPVVLSHDTSFILGVALQGIDEHDQSEELESGENTH